ncbi:PhoX family phosphatase [Paucibacter sp. JuS9]|uniref:PhoX family protein n=1 Tax=Paucibacter sp. JuS9 TaxID=3228748 RepID=UPI0037568FBA
MPVPWLGLSNGGAFQPGREDRGLLCSQLGGLVDRSGGTATCPEAVEREIYALGLGIAEFRRGTEGQVLPVPDSRLNRRISAATVIDFSGPARASALLATKFSGLGTRTRGTLVGSAIVCTPWGTCLHGEGDFLPFVGRGIDTLPRHGAKALAGLQRYGLRAGHQSLCRWEHAGKQDLFARWNAAVAGATAAHDYRNIANTFGWVVETDPFNPESVPAKRTALGRLKQAELWMVPAEVGQPITILMRDAEDKETRYRYVSRALWNPADSGKGQSAGSKYLDEGHLQLACRDAQGELAWTTLRHGRLGLEMANADYPFTNQADVLINARLAADQIRTACAAQRVL